LKLNKKINWKPEVPHRPLWQLAGEPGPTGIFRAPVYWGIPLPIWRSEDAKEEKCIGSIEELKTEIQKSHFSGIHGCIASGAY
jgi:isoleucyl-tRNA synthetase